MKKTVPQITDAEWLIMKVLWEKSPLANRDIISKISETSEWNNKTIETLLRRLVDKKAVGYRNINSKAREYFPVVSLDECICEENETFLQKVYNGSISMMMSFFLRQQRISKEEMEKLKSLLNENNE